MTTARKPTTVRRKVKSCPFCGRLPDVKSECAVDGTLYWVQCTNYKCQAMPQSLDFYERSTAIECWNDRRGK